MGLFHRQQVQLYSPHPPAECVARLRAVINSEHLFCLPNWFGTEPVSGRVTETSLRLSKRIWYRNSFQSFLFAKMRPEAGGTVISGKVGMHPFTSVFMCIWLGVAFIFGGIILVPSVRSLIAHPDNIQQETWVGCAVPLLMPTFGFCLVWCGRFLARNEDRFLTDFLSQTLDAKEHNPK